MSSPEDVAPTSFRIAFRRYRPHAVAVGLLTGLFGWWAIGDYIGGIVVGVGLFFAAILTAGNSPFLPSDLRARTQLERRGRE